MIRTFLAVELSDALRAQVARIQEALKQRLHYDPSRKVRLSWVQSPSIHLTIKFLGGTDEALIAPMQLGIEQAVRPHLPILIPLERLGAFPGPQQPRVLWIGPPESWEQGEGAKRLSALHEAVERSCESFGFTREDRPLSPHLTLARVKEGARQLGQRVAESGIMDRPVVAGELALDSMVLMRSELAPAGSRYTALWRFSVV
jgi:RNA 2',3'-cyclic 3'-phosphodiesterase